MNRRKFLKGLLVAPLALVLPLYHGMLLQAENPITFEMVKPEIEKYLKHLAGTRIDGSHGVYIDNEWDSTRWSYNE